MGDRADLHLLPAGTVVTSIPVRETYAPRYVKEAEMCRMCRHATMRRCHMVLGREKVIACIGYFPYLKVGPT